jgi:pimeloyl-ACP methyl ester carboxylesterase
MRQEGVTASSPVQFTGFSQGGLVAATLAASGDYNTRGLVTMGAPTAQVSFGSEYPAVLLEHTDDIVPALGGNRVDDDPVLVQREAFAGRETPPGVAVPSHDRDEYRRTAELADDARSAQLADAIAELDAFGRGAATVTSTTYVAERVKK